jgi:hypothetical protein
MDPVENSFVRQIGAGASGDKAGSGRHRLRFLRRGREAARAPASQKVIDKLRDVIDG